jgi:copper chaperone CopZ
MQEGQVMMNKATAKETGTWEVKRRIHIPNLTRTEEGVALEDTLADVDGVLQVSADPVKRRVLVDYLSTKTDYQSLEQAAAKAGFPPATGFWARLRSGWYQNEDLTDRVNAALPTAACCSKPPTGGFKSGRS